MTTKPPKPFHVEAGHSWAVAADRTTRAGKVHRSFRTHRFFSTLPVPSTLEGASVALFRSKAAALAAIAHGPKVAPNVVQRAVRVSFAVAAG